MAELKGSKTQQNLKDAFAGESQTNRRRLYFAKIAGNFRDRFALFRDASKITE